MSHPKTEPAPTTPPAAAPHTSVSDLDATAGDAFALRLGLLCVVVLWLLMVVNIMLRWVYP
jgi:hypothetical protein